MMLLILQNTATATSSFLLVFKNLLIYFNKKIVTFLFTSVSKYFDPITVVLLFVLLVILIFALILFIRFNRKLRESQRTLRENEERFRQLTKLTFEGIVIHNKGVLIDCNESFVKMFGYKREELLNKNIIPMIVDKDSIKIIEENVKDHVTKPYEVRGIKKNGKFIPVEIESRNIIYAGKEARVAALRDLSERKRQEAILEKEQWFFTTLMNNVPDSIYFKDLESKFIRANQNTVKKFGLNKAEDLSGKSDFDFFGKEHATPAYDDEQKIIETKKPIIGKIEKETWKDGSITWASTTKLPLIDKDGKVQGTFGITRDITELKEAQEKAIAEKEKFELLFRIVPSAVFTVDTEQKITSWNSMAEELTGFKAEEIINEKCIISAEKPCIYSCGLFDEKVPKPVVNAECIIRKKDGNLITVSKNIDYITDNNGNIIGGIESFVDISERKKQEVEIQKYSEELAELNRSKDRFFSIIAHDLRNPFVTLLGFSEMLIEDYNDFSDEEKIDYLKEMMKTSQTSYELLENLLQWSRSQTGRIKYEPVKLNFNKLLNDNLKLVEKSAELKNIKLNSEIDLPVFLNVDADMVTTVLRNLLTNALKFTPNNGEVTIGQRDTGKMTEIFVRDTGIGIQGGRLEKLFEIDQTSSTEGTAGEKGSGLGLVLVKEFVEKHGGRIRVESKVNIGTTFYFTLPKAVE